MEDQSSLIQFLKPVFDACDFNGDGYVKLHDLIALGKQHSGEGDNVEELESILRELDPEGNGRITFDDFCKRWKHIISTDTPMVITQDVDSPILTSEKQPRQRSYTDSEGFFEEPDSTSHSTTSTTDYCGDLDDVLNSPAAGEVDSPKSKQLLSIYSTFPPSGINRRKRNYPSIFHNEHLGSPVENGTQEEEGFEGFGERSDGEDSISAYSDYSEKRRATPLSHKRLSGTLVARQLRMVRSAHTSLHNSMEELTLGSPIHAYSDSESNILALSDQIQRLSTQVSSLQLDHADQEEKQKKLREENKLLVERLSGLEEQLDHQRAITNDKVEEESQRYKATLVKIQRDNECNLEHLQQKLSQAEVEIQSLKESEPMLRKELELCLEERRSLQTKYEDAQGELQERQREIDSLKLQLQKRREELEHEKRERIQEVTELTHRLEEYKEFRREARNHYDDKNDLIQQVELLKMENDRLRRSKDDLKAELLQTSSFLMPEKRESLADELVSADKEDILTALKDMENDNYRMRQYVDQLLMVIMEADPALLEKS